VEIFFPTNPYLQAGLTDLISMKFGTMGGLRGYHPLKIFSEL